MPDKISVVIPAYNVEGYIGKCLGCVLSQTYENLEVIIVNDGSADGTADVISRYTADPRLKHIEQKNAGVSAARNCGIDAATGEFLGFIDGDDYIEPGMYEALLNIIKQADADMSVCNYNLVYDDRVEYNYSVMRDEVIDLQTDVYEYFCKYCARPKPNNYIWTRLYKTKIIKESGIRFENFKISDDTLFNFKLLVHIRKIAMTDGAFYNYVQRPDSNIYTAGRKTNLAGVYADTFDAVADYYEANASCDLLACLPMHAFSRLRSVFFYSRLSGMSEDEIAGSIIETFRGRKIADYLTGAVR